jgi:hypothetical protein
MTARILCSTLSTARASIWCFRPFVLASPPPLVCKCGLLRTDTPVCALGFLVSESVNCTLSPLNSTEAA